MPIKISVKTLIKKLAKTTHQLKKIMTNHLIGEEQQNRNMGLNNYLRHIKSNLTETIVFADNGSNQAIFTDLIAQTLIYGCFMSWIRFCKEGNDPENFTLDKIQQYIPDESFLKEIFSLFTFPVHPIRLSQVFSKLERIFQKARFKEISDSETLMMTFYSQFLWEYNPKMAKKRGIVFTPEAIVRFIIRSLDYFMQSHFNKSEGVLSHDILFLDPAAGTMSFPCALLKFANNSFNRTFSDHPARRNKKLADWILQSFMNNVVAYEVLLVPYILGVLRTDIILEELTRNLNLQFYNIPFHLYNALSNPITLDPFQIPRLKKERIGANRFENDPNLLVILSNPPYNISSQNRFPWIESLINYNEQFFSEEQKNLLNQAKTLAEKQQLKHSFRKQKNDYIWDLQSKDGVEVSGYKGIQDDYVKFIRYAQWNIVQKGQGILAYVTNNYFLNGKIFRGMRSSLRKDFDAIWIINLHGDARKAIPASVLNEGITIDENVFDIKVGVAILFALRTPNHSDTDCRIFYTDKWGSRKSKFEFLTQSITQLPFIEVEKRQDYQFVPDHFSHRDRYAQFVYLPDIFYQYGTGIMTGNDRFITDIDRTRLETRIRHFLKGRKIPNNKNKKNKVGSPDNVPNQYTLEELTKNIIPLSYRGWDRRYICYTKDLIARSRFSEMQYLYPEQKNRCLIIDRVSRGHKGDSSVFITNHMFEITCNEASSSVGSFGFPLKRFDYHSDQNQRQKADSQYLPSYIFYRDPNNQEETYPLRALHSNIKQSFQKSLGIENDEIIFHYIYAVLFTPTYRDRYVIGLQTDFPRIPFPPSTHLIQKMAKLGKRLADLHLFQADDIDSSQFPRSPSEDYKIYYIRRNDVNASRDHIPTTYDPETRKIYFQKRTQAQRLKEKQGEALTEIMWIGGISPRMWKFEIGGRQQLKTWLYSRRYSLEPKRNTISRGLTAKELEYFLQMCAVIKESIALQPQLNKIYEKIDKI